MGINLVYFDIIIQLFAGAPPATKTEFAGASPANNNKYAGAPPANNIEFAAVFYILRKPRYLV